MDELRAFEPSRGQVRDFLFPNWTQGECLGAGSFGKVYKCATCDDEIFAVKIVQMETQGTETKEVKALINEIHILKKLTHERIVSYHGSELKGGHLHLFMDFMAGGSLSACITKSGALSEDESRRYTNQMLQGIEFLHSQYVIHRDIKGSNVLLDGRGNVKLADFGLSKMIQKVGSKTNLVSECGTSYWMAPEILWGEGYGRKADIWSLGCTVVEMLTGKPPLGDLQPAAALFRIGSRPIELTLPYNVSQNAEEFIMAALTWKPDERPWSNELQCYAFVNWGPAVERKRESPGGSAKHPMGTHAVKEGSPEDDGLERLANQIINEWKALGRRLLIHELLLDAIHHDNDEYSEKAYKMLLTWKATNGSDATFRVLHDALCHPFINRRDLAEKFCKVTDD